MDPESLEFNDADLISSSFSVLQDMRKKSELVDLKIVIQNRCFSVHRVVLAAGIPYLRVMFATSTNEILLDAIDPEVFEDVVNYAYCGKIKIHAGNVQSLLSASQILELTKVHDVCVKFTAMQINVKNVFAMRSFAWNIRSLKLTVTCDWYILRNFEEFVAFQRSEFVQLPLSYLKEIISSDDLTVTKEEKVFEAVMHWVKASPAERYNSLHQLLAAVRMTLITPDYLVNKISKEELVMNSLLCKNLVEDIKDYHLSVEKLPLSVGVLSTHPRNTRGHGLYAICKSALGLYIEMYDAQREIWIPLSYVGSQRWMFFVYFGAAVVDNVVGFNGKVCFFWNGRKEIEIFDPTTLKREYLKISEGSCISKNSFHRVIMHRNRFYASSQGEIFRFDLTLRTWLKMKVGVGCSLFGVASLGDYIYITGGQIHGSAIPACKKYNPDTGILSNISPMLCGRHSHCSTCLNKRLYVCDSFDGEVYNPVTNQWNSIASMTCPPPTCLISLSAYKGKLYALKREMMAIYDPQHNTWIRGAPLSPACKFETCVTVPSM